jgi:SAM-dependent methyltransferase
MSTGKWWRGCSPDGHSDRAGIHTGRETVNEATGRLPSTFDDGDLYDLIGDFPYALDFYVGMARAARGPVLDVACGTGRILLPCLAEGIDIEGLDFYEGMLARLRKKAAARGLSPTLHRADMSDFRLERRYGFIMIPFNAFIHNVTQEAQIGCLTACREHLLPGGLLVFDTFFPAAQLTSTPPGTRVLEGELPHPETGLPMRMYDTRTIDPVAQEQHSVNELEILAADGSIERVHRSQVLGRYIYKQEMALLLKIAGFSRWEIHGDFDRRPLTKETDNMIVEAWR